MIADVPSPLGKLVFVAFLLAASAISADVDPALKPLARAPRGLGFFHKITHLGSLLYQQYNDTTYTLKNVYDLLSNEFTDTFTTTTPDVGLALVAAIEQTNVFLLSQPRQPRTTTTTPDPATSTTPKYRISRAELGRILNRNYRGLQKLFRLEWNDAWNQTKYNIDGYKRELKNSAFPPRNRTAIAANLTVQVDAKLKSP
ncbi:AGAP000695-PA-like protein [Anopheles sinensis]|uniref:AGAP000695-PA-like protein n=1 Tax=Anopheles sinensis TaxID=74873 RepID=A0A084VVE3_ANOSI|nr:AGAP000695-PA-like protein [Anopheles sinensis]